MRRVVHRTVPIAEYYDDARAPRIDVPIGDIVRRYRAGATQAEIARTLGVNQSTVARRIREYRKAGNGIERGRP